MTPPTSLGRCEHCPRKRSKWDRLFDWFFWGGGDHD